jgi:cephalosporin hydroxylase
MLYIGPERLRLAAQEGVGVYDLVDVPLTTAFDEIDRIVSEAEEHIKAKNYRLVGVSAGPAAKIIIDRLFTQFPKTSFIDFGSMLDMYAGVPTRSGAKKLSQKEIDWLAWKNFHWQRPKMLVMPYPSIHDLMWIPGLVSESEANFLYQTASKVKGTIVELGTFWGRTAAIMARTGNKVISIDNYSYPYHPPVGGPAKKLSKYNLKARFIKGDSTVIPKGVSKVALLYVDSDHTYEHVSKELETWLPLVTDIVVFHDYDTDTYSEVTRAVDDNMKSWKRLGQERRMIAFGRR